LERRGQNTFNKISQSFGKDVEQYQFYGWNREYLVVGSIAGIKTGSGPLAHSRAGNKKLLNLS
jgi:hypothetical protein